MTTRTRGTIIVRILPIGATDPNEIDLKERFWLYVTRHSTELQIKEFQSDDFERRLIRNLGKSLKRQLAEYFDPLRKSSLPTNPEPSPKTSTVGDKLIGIFFEARILGYDSLSLGIDIEGLNRLAEIFDHNFSLFVMFFNAYLPVAFEGESGLHIDAGLSPFEYQSDFSSLEDAFAAQTPVTTAIRDRLRDPETRAKWIWSITNFSLVVPVLLALLVLYVALNWIAEERRELSSRMERTFTAQEALIKDYQERLRMMEKLEQFILEKQIGDSSKTSRRK